MGYWTAFYPADVVKSCIQTGRGIENLPAPRPGTPPRFWDVFRHLAVQEGMGGLYKGWGITVARVRLFPSPAVTPWQPQDHPPLAFRVLSPRLPRHIPRGNHYPGPRVRTLRSTGGACKRGGVLRL